MSTDTAATATDDEIAQTPGRSPVEAAAWVLPLLREYAGKLADLADQIHRAGRSWHAPGMDGRAVWLPEAARLVALHDTLRPSIEQLASYASGLANGGQVDYELRLELLLRRNEAEEGLRFAKVTLEELLGLVKKDKSLDALRTLIERSGRYKSPV